MYKFSFNKPEKQKESIGSILVKAVLIAGSLAAIALVVYAVVKKIRSACDRDTFSDIFCDEEDCANCEGCDIDVEDSEDSDDGEDGEEEDAEEDAEEDDGDPEEAEEEKEDDAQ